MNESEAPEFANPNTFAVFKTSSCINSSLLLFRKDESVFDDSLSSPYIAAALSDSTSVLQRKASAPCFPLTTRVVTILPSSLSAIHTVVSSCVHKCFAWLLCTPTLNWVIFWPSFLSLLQRFVLAGMRACLPAVWSLVLSFVATFSSQLHFIAKARVPFVLVNFEHFPTAEQLVDKSLETLALFYTKAS